MLYDQAQLQRHNINERGGLEGPRRKSRFAPIRDGKTTLVRIEFGVKDEVDEEGSPTGKKVFDVRKGPRASSISFKAIIVEGQQEGRWFYDRFVLSGFTPGVMRTVQCLTDMVSCYTPGCESPTKKMVHGRVFPVAVRQVPHYQNGRMTNEIITLSADPDSGDYEVYHELVKRCMKMDDRGEWDAIVPGWDLYPGSPSEKLVLKRKRDREEVLDGAGVTRLELRRAANTTKAVRRMASASATPDLRSILAAG